MFRFRRKKEEPKPEKKALYARFDAGKAPEFEFDKYMKNGTLYDGAFYKVVDVDMGWCSTDIKLEGVQDRFNSVAFDFYMVENGNMIPHDIYEDPAYNPYIKVTDAGNNDSSSELQPNM